MTINQALVAIAPPQFARRINLWVNIEIYLSLSLSFLLQKSNCNDSRIKWEKEKGDIRQNEQVNADVICQICATWVRFKKPTWCETRPYTWLPQLRAGGQGRKKANPRTKKGQRIWQFWLKVRSISYVSYRCPISQWSLKWLKG